MNEVIGMGLDKMDGCKQGGESVCVCVCGMEMEQSFMYVTPLNVG